MVVLLAIVAFGGARASPQSTTTSIGPDELKWAQNPAPPKGFQSVTLIGDPAKSGDMVVQRIQLPAHLVVPPHTHPFAETITVLSGEVGFGMGEKVDANTLASKSLQKSGAFFAHPANDPHYVWTDEQGAVVQIQFIAPGGINYVNPADDPRKK